MISDFSWRKLHSVLRPRRGSGDATRRSARRFSLPERRSIRKAVWGVVETGGGQRGVGRPTRPTTGRLAETAGFCDAAFLGERWAVTIRSGAGAYLARSLGAWRRFPLPRSGRKRVRGWAARPGSGEKNMVRQEPAAQSPFIFDRPPLPARFAVRFRTVLSSFGQRFCRFRHPGRDYG